MKNKFQKIKRNNLSRISNESKGKLMTTGEVAEALGVSIRTVQRNAKTCLPNKEIVNGKPTYWSEEEVTILIEYMKRNNNRTDLASTTVVEAAETSLTSKLIANSLYKDCKGLPEVEKIRLAEQLFKDALNSLYLKEKQQKESLQIQLDESKEWYSIKRIEKLNPDVKFDWRMIKKESEKLGKEIKKVFDQNYGEVNAYHVSVYESIYFDTLNYGD